jgi:hypothetical protein
METIAGLGIKTLDEISEENVTYVDTISIDRNEMSEIHCLSDLIPRSFLSPRRTCALIIGAGRAISRKERKGNGVAELEKNGDETRVFSYWKDQQPEHPCRLKKEIELSYKYSHNSL